MSPDIAASGPDADTGHIQVTIGALLVPAQDA